MEHGRTRAARPEDAPAIASVHVASWQAAYRGQLPDVVLENLSVDRRAETWSDVIAATGPADAVLVMERAGVLRGLRSCLRGARFRRRRRHGGGVLPLSPCGDLGPGAGARAHGSCAVPPHGGGFTSAILWVLATNDRARRFYEAGGWERDGAERTELIGGARVAEVRYRRELGTRTRRSPDRHGHGRRPAVAGISLGYGALGSLGRPRARSPTMLRWISAAPPQIVSDREKKYEDWMSSTG